MLYSPTKRAFTIIELLVATSIIGIIAASTLASFAHQRLVARNSQRKDVATTYSKAIGAYEASKGTSYVTDKDPSDKSVGCTGDLINDDGTGSNFLKSTTAATQCVGLDGRSYGRMGASLTNITGTLLGSGNGSLDDLGGKYFSTESILDALQKLGFLGTISTDPSLPKNLAKDSQIKESIPPSATLVASNVSDYLLIRCCKDGRESIGTGGSVYAVWTHLETDGTAQTNSNTGECGSLSAAKTVASTYSSVFPGGYAYSFGGGKDANDKLFAPKSLSTLSTSDTGDWFAVGNGSAQKTVSSIERCSKSA